MRKYLPSDETRTAIYFCLATVLIGYAASMVSAQPRGVIDPQNVGSTPKWSVTVFADGKPARAWQADAVEYMGHGVFSFRADDHRDVMVSGTVVCEANW